MAKEARFDADAQRSAAKNDRARVSRISREFRRRGESAVPILLASFAFPTCPIVPTVERFGAKDGCERVVPSVVKTFDADFSPESVFRDDRRQNRAELGRAMTLG